MRRLNPSSPRRRGVPKTGRLEFDLGFCYRYCVIPAKLVLDLIGEQESRTKIRKKLLDTRFRGYDGCRSFPELANVHFVHISQNFAPPRGEGFAPSPEETLINEGYWETF